MMSNTASTPLRSGTFSTSYSLLAGFITPFDRRRNNHFQNTEELDHRTLGEEDDLEHADISNEDYYRLSLSGIYMRAAVVPGRSITHLTSPAALQLLRSYYSTGSQFLIWVALLLLNYLTFVEDGLHKWDRTWTLSIELFCFFVLVTKSIEKRSFMGDAAFAKDPSSIVHLCLIGVLLLDFCVGVFPRQVETSVATGDPIVSSPSTPIHLTEYSYRYGRAFRPFLMMEYAPNVRTRLIGVCIAAWSAKTVLLLLVFNLLFFTVVGTVIFHSTAEGVENFKDFETSLITLVVLQTTSNHPDVIVPGYEENRWSVLYFVSFLLVAHFLLLNLVLGVIYHEHIARLKTSSSTELLESYVASRVSLAALCNDLGTGRGVLTAEFMDTVKMLMIEFNITKQSAIRLLHRCGGTEEMGITREQYSRISAAMRLKLSSFGEEAEFAGDGSILVSLKHFLTLRYSENFTYVDCFVVVSLSIELAITIFLMNRNLDDFLLHEEHGGILKLFSTCLTLVFVVELLLKLMVYGFNRFSDDLWNIFDSIVVFISLLGALNVSSPKAYTVLAEAKLMRLLRVVPGFRTITGTAAAFAPAAGPSVAGILCIFYSVAVIVVGGLGDVVLAPEDYHANDFRDFIAALVTLFELAVVNDWNETMAAFVKATGTKWVQVFFIAWWAVSQLVLINLVTSLILDGFEVRMKELNALGEMGNKGYSTNRSRTSSIMQPPESKKLSLLRTLSTNDEVESDNETPPFARSTSFTVGRMFFELFRNIDEPTDSEVDIACWERGIRVGVSPYQ